MLLGSQVLWGLCPAVEIKVGISRPAFSWITTSKQVLVAAAWLPLRLPFRLAYCVLLRQVKTVMMEP